MTNPIRPIIELSVVIPVYNSQEVIGLVVTSLLELYDSLYVMEIILVNDGSSDNSYEVCLELMNLHPQIKFITLETNCGQQVAIMTGLKAAQGHYLVLIDDDMQNPPEEVIKLITKLNEGYDVVIGSRNQYQQNGYRKFASHINNVIVNFLLRSDHRLELTNFISMRKSILSEVIKSKAPNPNILVQILKITKNVTNTPTQHRKREIGKSNYNLFKLFRHWLNALIHIILNRN